MDLEESNSIEARMRNEVESEDEYLNRYELRLCECGCGEPVSGPAAVRERSSQAAGP